MKRFGFLTAAVLLSCALCVIPACAAKDLILDQVFSGNSPSQAAQDLLIRVDAAAEADGLRFSVDEALFDGNRLLFSCTAVNETGEARLLALDLRDAEALVSYWPEELSNQRFLWLEARDERVFDLTAAEGLQAPFDVALNVTFAKPAARTLDEEAGVGLNFSGVPTLLRGADGFVHPCSECTYERTRKPDGGERTVCEWDAPELPLNPTLDDFARGGYIEAPVSLPIAFAVQPGAQARHTAVEGAARVTANGFVYDFAQADFATASTRIRFQLHCPSGYLPADLAEYEARARAGEPMKRFWFSALADGREIENLGYTSALKADAEGLYYDVTMEGDPVEFVPGELRIVPELRDAREGDETFEDRAGAIRLRLVAGA